MYFLFDCSLEYEGIIKTTDHKDLASYAMDRYAYYVCFKCQKVNVIYNILEWCRVIKCSLRHTTVAKHVATPNWVTNTIPKSWCAVVAVMWHVPKCVPNTGPIFSNTNADTVVRWPCFSALAPHTFVTHAMTIFSV